MNQINVQLDLMLKAKTNKQTKTEQIKNKTETKKERYFICFAAQLVFVFYCNYNIIYYILGVLVWFSILLIIRKETETALLSNWNPGIVMKYYFL